MLNTFFKSLNNIYLAVYDKNLQKEFKSFTGTILSAFFLAICLLSGPVIGKILFVAFIPHTSMYEVIVIFSSFVFSMSAFFGGLFILSKIEHSYYKKEYPEYFNG